MNLGRVKIPVAFIIGMLTFAFGVAVPPPFLDITTAPDERAVESALANATPISNRDPSDLDELGCMGDNIDYPPVGPRELSTDRIMTTVCGTVFVKDRDGSVVWRRTLASGLTDEPKVINGELVVVGQDLNLLGLEPNDGTQLWDLNGNGRAGYVQTEPFGKDMYLLLVDMTGYDGGYEKCVGTDFENEEKWDKCPRTEPDEVRLIRRNEILEEWAVPAGPRLVVDRGRVFAEYRQRGKRKRLEIIPRKINQ